MANPPKIVFIGDAWLKKITEVFTKLYGADHVTYVSETADEPELATSDVVVRSWSEVLGKADLICPRFNIDGLATVEMSGAGGNRTFLGASVLHDLIETLPDMKIATSALQGEIEFDCVARLNASFAALEAQEAVAVPICDFLRAQYPSQPILTGCKKPAPIVTVEMARRIAERLTFDLAAFDQVDAYFLGELATKASRLCLMPYDAKKLGLTYATDPFWFPTFGGMFKDIASDFRKKK